MEHSKSHEAFNAVFDDHLPPLSPEYFDKVEANRYVERMGRENAVLRRLGILTATFESRKEAILKQVRSTHTKNLTSLSVSDIAQEMKAYEERVATQPRLRSGLQGFFLPQKSEAVLVGGVYHLVPTKDAFFSLLAKEIHAELFEKPEFFKNVSGIFATRLEPGAEVGNPKTQVLLVQNKNGVWQFPGGKAEYVARNLASGKTEIVTKNAEEWLFADGSTASPEEVTFESPAECLKREISEELGINIDSVTLDSSGFYTIAHKRFLIHGFVANDLFTADALSRVSEEKLNKGEVAALEWTNDPFVLLDGSPRPLTDQTKAVLTRLFRDNPFLDREGASIFGTPESKNRSYA